MNIGVIIVFQSHNLNFDIKHFIKQFQESEGLVFCLVDCETSEKTSELLTTLSESSENISKVNLKNHTDEAAAVKAGARFIFNSYNLKHIGFINYKTVVNTGYNLNEILSILLSDREQLLDYNSKIIKNKLSKYVSFKSVFSVLDCMLTLQLITKYKLSS